MECHATRKPEKLSPTSKNSTPDCQVWNAKYSIVKQERLCSKMKEGVPDLFKGSLGEFRVFICGCSSRSFLVKLMVRNRYAYGSSEIHADEFQMVICTMESCS